MSKKTTLQHCTCEEGEILDLDFSKIAKMDRKMEVIPVAVQNSDSGDVILIAYVNEQALRASLKTRIATFWSTSRDTLWVKGKTSGNLFDLIEIYVNCEQNSLVYKVRPQKGGICHTKNNKSLSRDSCYYRRLDMTGNKLKKIDP